MKRPAKRKHECCPNAATNLVGQRCTARYAWRILDPHTGLLLVSVIYCPWCGCELNEWTKLQEAAEARSLVRLVTP